MTLRPSRTTPVTCRSNRRRPMWRAGRSPSNQAHKGLPQDVFARIVTAVPTEDAARRYGLNLDRHGMCCCPLHGEKTPSFKVYPGDDGFYCFGCGVGGDVLTLVERLYGLSPVQAAKKLDADFALGLFGEPARTEPDTWKARRDAQRAEEARREAKDWALVRMLHSIYTLPAPVPGDDEYAAVYALQQANAEYLEYLRESKEKAQ